MAPSKKTSFDFTPELKDIIEQLNQLNGNRPKTTLGFPTGGLNPAVIPDLYPDGYFSGCSGIPERVDKEGEPIYPDPK